MPCEWLGNVLPIALRIIGPNGFHAAQIRERLADSAAVRVEGYLPVGDLVQAYREAGMYLYIRRCMRDSGCPLSSQWHVGHPLSRRLAGRCLRLQAMLPSSLILWMSVLLQLPFGRLGRVLSCANSWRSGDFGARRPSSGAQRSTATSMCTAGRSEARLRIAIVGTRGIPAAYGGFETLAWELSTRLAQRGHEVTVYCRRGRTDESIAVPHGVKRRFLPVPAGQVPRDREPHRPLGHRQPVPRLRRDVGRQRRQRRLLRDPEAPGHQGRAQRRWDRAPAGEVGAGRAGLVRASASGSPSSTRRRSSPMPT